MTAPRSRAAPAQRRTEVERLMGEMREANERLIVAAIHAQNLSDEARAEASRVRAEIDGLLNRLHTMAQEAGNREEQYRQLSSQLLTLQDEERRRLAIDLHDSTSQCLAALTMNLDMIDRTSATLDARSRRALAESRALAEQCSRQVRTFAYLLHPPLLDERGLVPAVRWYAEGFTQRSGIQVVMELAAVGRLPQPIETALFRVVQESLTNVHRHAATTAASIRLSLSAGAVALEIQDHGRGLRDPLAQPQATALSVTLGVGIQGMRERIRQLDGTFDIAFTDTGTTVRVHVPLNEGIP